MLNAANRLALVEPPVEEPERLRRARVFAAECATAALQVFERQWQGHRVPALERRSPVGVRCGR
jgi:hypothetical protein